MRPSPGALGGGGAKNFSLPAGIAAMARMGTLGTPATITPRTTGEGKGAPAAARSERAPRNPPPERPPPEPLELGEWPEGYAVGTVVRRQFSSGNSFISAPDSGFDKDIYCHSSVAWPEFVKIGDVVAFQVHENKQGQHQASAPLWKRCGRVDQGKPVTFGEYKGCIRRFLPGGAGFVECEEVKAKIGSDAYIQRETAAECGLAEKQHVMFDIHMNEKGQPQISMPVWICSSEDRLWLGTPREAREEGAPTKGGTVRRAPDQAQDETMEMEEDFMFEDLPGDKVEDFEDFNKDEDFEDLNELEHLLSPEMASVGAGKKLPPRAPAARLRTPPRERSRSRSQKRPLPRPAADAKGGGKGKW